MALKPEISVPVAAAVGTLVLSIYNNALPSLIDVRVQDAGDQHLDAARKGATWTAAALVSGVSLLAKDPTIFIVGGGLVVITDWWYRHGNEVLPHTGKASVAMNRRMGLEGMAPTEAEAPAEYGYAGDTADGDYAMVG